MKKLFDWLLDRDNCRSHPALLTSMTGEVLLRSSGRRGFYTTDVGMQRAHVHSRMFLGDNAEICKMILKGDFNFCLTKDDKEGYKQKINEAVAKGGEYWDTKRNSRGTLDFFRNKWKSEDLMEIKKLLESL